MILVFGGRAAAQRRPQCSDFHVNAWVMHPSALSFEKNAL